MDWFVPLFFGRFAFDVVAIIKKLVTGRGENFFAPTHFHRFTKKNHNHAMHRRDITCLVILAKCAMCKIWSTSQIGSRCWRVSNSSYCNVSASNNRISRYAITKKLPHPHAGSKNSVCRNLAWKALSFVLLPCAFFNSLLSASKNSGEITFKMFSSLV